MLSIPQHLISILTLLAGVFSFSIILLIYLFMARKKAEKEDEKKEVRLTQISQRHLISPLLRKGIFHEKSVLEKNIESVLTSKLVSTKDLGRSLLQAGVRVSLSNFILLSLMCGIIGGTVISIVLDMPIYLDSAMTLFIGFFVPSFFLWTRRHKRKKKFLSLFPTALDMIVRSVKAGHSIQRALKLAGEEVESPVGDVFSHISSQLDLGIPLEIALSEAAEQVGVQDFNFFAISLILQKETGGSIGDALTNLSQIVREREELRLKIAALTGEVRITSIIIGGLPFFAGAVLQLIDPLYISKFTEDPTGKNLLLIAVFMMLVGALSIVRLTRVSV